MLSLQANGQDPDGDRLTYRWSAPTGTFQNGNQAQTTWTAPNQEGTVPITVTVDDGRGGMATASANAQVVRPPARTYTFDEVYFDFDRSTLRPEGTAVLDEVVRALQSDSRLHAEIDGYTDDIGTPEYNMALGERRANAVREYLVSRGIPASQLSVVSYGLERAKYDNSREETRRLNRRAAFVVTVR
jgi:peptidoglycan-associated lipoprotein